MADRHAEPSPRSQRATRSTRKPSTPKVTEHGASSRGKRVVVVNSGADQREAEAGPVWQPTPEAHAKSRKLRWIAAALWAVAIAAEITALVWMYRQTPFTTTHVVILIAAIVVIGLLSIGGSLLWKTANRYAPASRRDPVRFFVQNQLGAILAVLAFLPLIVLVFTNKNMSGKQKGIVGAVAIVVALAATLFGIDWDQPSQEQYAEETNIVAQLTGENLVFWTKSGSVFHVCEEVPDVNRASKDGTIYSGTVAEAHQAGKSRLTKRWESEAIKYCGYSQEDVDRVNGTTAEHPGADNTADDTADQGDAGGTD